MQVIIAGSCGFCFGVKRAVKLAEDAKASRNARTYGPIIHNAQVIDHLKKSGICPVDHLEECPEGSTIIFRSHGVSPEVYKQANARGLTVIDATCPFVTKAQQAAQRFAEQGYQVVIAGDKHHPEVQSIIDWAGSKTLVVGQASEVEFVPKADVIGLVAQTTLDTQSFEQIKGALSQKCRDLQIDQTICAATHERQNAAVALAKRSDIMIVVGGKHSANTTKLADLCIRAGTETHHIETASELRPEWFSGKQNAGLTAGASTPDWIIEEVYQAMQDIDFSQAIVDSMKKLKKGDIVQSTVVQVGKEDVMVDIGYKSEGIIPQRELTLKKECNPADIVKVGDIIDVYVISTEDKEGNVLLSKKRADQVKGWASVEQAFINGQVLHGIFDNVVKGGLIVSVHGVRGFMPASQVSTRFITDLQLLVGEEAKFKIIELDRENNKCVLSQRIVLEQERKQAEQVVWENIEEGKILKGTVKNIMPYGAFVDIGGVEGMLHISDMAWHRVKHPSEIVKTGDEVEVVVTKLDISTRRISLGLKQVSTNPWDDVKEKYAAGTIINGVVTKIMQFGAFVELEPGVEGLVHISQLSDKRIAKADEVVSAGQQVKVKVLDINQEEKRISLSIREVELDEEHAEYQEYINKQQANTVTLGEKIAADGNNV